ncbi:MAG TPA: alpha-ketoacid dehydrogenase subunit beta [Thermomicrobiales bacterium]|nr:alpha-ketoacid dehydrogenase subunit beta [Thermomicrobiales bacterium]
MPTKTIIEAVRDGIREEMARDDSVVIMGEDVGFKGGVFKATVGLLDEFGAERVVDTPLAESGIVGTAIGAALNGLRPIAEIQFADFIHPAMDQIINEAAKIRYRSNGDFGCPMVVRAPFGGGIHGGLYHSQSVEAFFAHVPGLKVVIPGNPYDAKGLLKSAIRDPDPVLFFEHKRTYRLFRQEVPDEDYTVPLGKARVAREGDDLTVIAYGLMLHYSLQAAEELAKDGISVEVVDLRTLVPLDTATILDSVKKTNKALIVHEDTRTGGFGGELAAVIAEDAFEYLDGPIRRLTGPDVPAMPFNTKLEEAFLPNPERIAQAIRDLAAY